MRICFSTADMRVKSIDVTDVAPNKSSSGSSLPSGGNRELIVAKNAFARNLCDSFRRVKKCARSPRTISGLLPNYGLRKSAVKNRLHIRGARELLRCYGMPSPDVYWLGLRRVRG